MFSKFQFRFQVKCFVVDELVPWVSKVAAGVQAKEGRELSDLLMRTQTAINFVAKRESEATRRWNTLQQENKFLRDQVRSVRAAVKKYKIRTHEVELAADKRVKLMLSKIAAIENPPGAEYETAQQILDADDKKENEAIENENEKPEENQIEDKKEDEAKEDDIPIGFKDDEDPKIEAPAKPTAETVSDQGST